MTKKTTRTNDYTQPRQPLFMAFDLGSREWKLGFTTGLGQKPRIRTMPAGDLNILQKEIDAAKKRFGLPADTEVVSCFEAGRDGLWLDRYLNRVGVKNIVVDSASIEVNRRARRAKADKLDVSKLVTMLIRHHLGEHKLWRIVAVPSPEEEDQRQPHRELRQLQRNKTAIKNRIKGLLASQGIRPSRLPLSDQALDELRSPDGLPLQPQLKARLRRQGEELGLIVRHIAALERNRDEVICSEAKDMASQQIQQLATLRAVGPVSATVLVRELFWRKFNNQRQVGSLTGYTPTPYASGTIKIEQGISKAGIRHVRSVGVELAWAWIRYQPKSPLTQWFKKRFADASKGARKVGIVAVARRLVIALWRFLETGAPPEGALLKSEGNLLNA